MISQLESLKAKEVFWHKNWEEEDTLSLREDFKHVQLPAKSGTKWFCEHEKGQRYSTKHESIYIASN